MRLQPQRVCNPNPKAISVFLDLSPQRATACGRLGTSAVLPANSTEFRNSIGENSAFQHKAAPWNHAKS